MLLKSSDFILHDLSADSVFEGCVDIDDDDDDDDDDDSGLKEGSVRGSDTQGNNMKKAKGYELELVLRKWFAIDPSREMRAFVRDGVLIGAYNVFRLVLIEDPLFSSSSCLGLVSFLCFTSSFVSPSRCTHSHTPLLSHTHTLSLINRFFFIGISQRDMNNYEFLNEPSTQRKIVSSFVKHWTTHVKPKWTGPSSCESLSFLKISSSRPWVGDVCPRVAHANARVSPHHRYARRATHA
jgi:hypothetical protein